MADIELKDVKKTFGSVNVIKGVDLNIRSGEFMVFVGPSGCGKSTLLRLIAGLEEISSGTLSIGGKVVNRLTPKDRGVAMVFQSYALYPHMNVYDNMAFGMQLSGSDKGAIAKRINEAAEMLQITPYLQRLPKQLSGGQRQRVAMGRAIVRDPKVFLFDEPLSNLDAKLRAQMRTEIKALHQSLKTTAVYVTHDQVEAMTMANRIAVMNEGVIQQVGPPLEVYDRPANVFVAGFIGSPTMNFVDAVASLKGKPSAILNDGSSLPIATMNVKDGQLLTLGFRPEHLQMATTGLAGEVLVVEPLGMMTQVVVKAAGTHVELMVLERTDIAPGTRVRLTISPSHIHTFDRQTGRRIE